MKKMKKMEIKIRKNLDDGLKKAALDLGQDYDGIFNKAVSVYLIMLTLDKTDATIVAAILQRREAEIREEIK